MAAKHACFIFMTIIIIVMPAQATDTALDSAGGTTTPDATPPNVSCTRPAIKFNRWQEDWSVLANPCVPKRPLHALKYEPLFGDPQSYVSLGMVLRDTL